MSSSPSAHNDSTARTAAQAENSRSGAWTVRALLAWMVPYLSEREVDSPRAVAEILLGSVLGCERLKLYMEPDRELDPDALTKLRALVTRAGRHEPVQYLVGRWPFFGRDFEVGPATLIPRPCTEVLVERAIAWMRERTATQPSASMDVLDLCTGTGCIAISLALGLRAIQRPEGAGCRPLRGADSSTSPRPSQLPVARNIALDNDAPSSGGLESDEGPASAASSLETSKKIVATDLIADAVQLARRNAERLGATIDLRVGDLYSALREDERFDLIVSNPPYVTDAEYEELDRNVREFEPASALKGGVDGLHFVRAVVAGAEKRLRSGGLLLVEIGWKHGDAVRKLGTRSGWRDVEVLSDGDGHERVLVAHRA